jgi:hypothetical protein
MKPIIRVLCTAYSRTDLDNLEVQNITKAKASGITLLNKTSGGGGRAGQKLSLEHRRKLHNPEVWAKMSATKKGRPSKRSTKAKQTMLKKAVI